MLGLYQVSNEFFFFSGLDAVHLVVGVVDIQNDKFNWLSFFEEILHIDGGCKFWIQVVSWRLKNEINLVLEPFSSSYFLPLRGRRAIFHECNNLRK